VSQPVNLKANEANHDKIRPMHLPQLPDSKLYGHLLENSFDGICLVNSDRRITFWNHGAERITGRPPSQVVGEDASLEVLQHIDETGLQLEGMNCPLIGTLHDGINREVEVIIRHAEGYPIPVLVRTFPVHSRTGRLVGAVEMFSDNRNLKRLKRREESLEQTSAYDPLTQVGNRKHLEQKVRAALMELGYSGLSFGILFIDIDHFKSFNDTYGHNTGDKVLRAVANTLRHNLRDTDTCGRWGGEEFLAIVFDVEEHTLQTLAEKLRILVTQAIIKADRNIPSVTVSIGATLARAEDSLESLIHRADKLMYLSKSQGRNRTSFG
jgi:diguanylate cyclase (GGDEF)-like protein/PAS domain S-box-containing protein